MRAARCENCSQLVFFENSLCLHCESPIGFDVPTLEIVTLIGDLEDAPRCANIDLAGCNWLVEKDDEELCLSCRMTSVRPEKDDTEGLVRYHAAEIAKRRVIRQLLTLGFPVDEDKIDFKLENSTDEKPVMTGHDNGTITLDLAESDDARRTARREQLGEPYRTLVGHFRHELGHYYQDILLNTEQKWDGCRAMFGDERDSYEDALERHYKEGPPKDWHDNFVSAYATMHPWEDWAETFAHYLHIRAVLETSADFGVSVEGPRSVNADGDRDEFEASPQFGASDRSFGEIWDNWLPLTYALNQINRAMGKEDLYPFVLAQPAVDKLTYMHLLVRAQKNENELAETAAGAKDD